MLAVAAPPAEATVKPDPPEPPVALLEPDRVVALVSLSVRLELAVPAAPPVPVVL